MWRRLKKRFAVGLLTNRIRASSAGPRMHWPFGALERTRTVTGVSPPAPQTGVSTNSTTRAHRKMREKKGSEGYSLRHDWSTLRQAAGKFGSPSQINQFGFLRGPGAALVYRPPAAIRVIPRRYPVALDNPVLFKPRPAAGPFDDVGFGTCGVGAFFKAFFAARGVVADDCRFYPEPCGLSFGPSPAVFRDHRAI